MEQSILFMFYHLDKLGVPREEQSKVFPYTIKSYKYNNAKDAYLAFASKPDSTFSMIYTNVTIENYNDYDALVNKFIKDLKQRFPSFKNIPKKYWKSFYYTICNLQDYALF